MIPSVYHEFKEFGDEPIRGTRFCRVQKVIKNGKRSFRLVPPALVDTEPTRIAKPIIDRVWEVYKSYSAVDLSKMTHQPGSPWDTTRRGSGDRRGTDIPDELIKDYFKNLRARQKR